MKPTRLQFGLRENTASPRQHASRHALSSSSSRFEDPPSGTHKDLGSFNDDPTTMETLNLHLKEPGQEATGEKIESVAADPRTHGQFGLERPLTCEEAAAFVRVHPKTVKRMARTGQLPGHFRFGRWFFYASELDYWMRTELHSTRHSCR
jgi:excisionase family DNA binding protein